MRPARLTTAPLVLAAHGSKDPRFAATIESLAAQLGALRPGLEVRIGYLEHDLPVLHDEPGVVVVPVFLSSGFHVTRDIPARVPSSVVTAAVAPDRRISEVLAARLREAGWRGEQPVVLAAAGSEHERAVADVRQAARDLGQELDVAVSPAFVSAGQPRLADLVPAAVVSYLLAPGQFADRVASSGAPIVTAPIGPDPVIAQIALDRYDEALARR